jgi:hypothetical protein
MVVVKSRVRKRVVLELMIKESQMVCKLQEDVGIKIYQEL